MLLRETRMGSKRLKYEFPGYTVKGQVRVILFASIAHATHVLLVRSICRTNKMEFFGCNLWMHRWCARVSKLEYKCD